MERYVVMRVLLALFLLFVVVFGIIRIAGSGGDDGNNPAPGEEEEKPYVLSEQINNDSEVRLIIIGKTNGLEDHREIHFSINERRRLVELRSGYDGRVLDSTRLANTDNAYQEFLFAIDASGFLLKWVTPEVSEQNGACATGKTYVYQALNRGQVEKELWGSSCGRRVGTSAGNRTQIVNFFEAQFPDYNDFISGVRL